MNPHGLRRWAPALVASLVLGAVGIVAAYGGGQDSAASIDPGTLESVLEEDSLPGTDVVDSAPEVTEAPPSTVGKTRIKRTLAKGTRGNDVKRMQQRLVDLGYDPGVVDGVFGEKTRAAVWAFEKLVMQVPARKVTGKVNNAMWQRMQDRLVVKPKRKKTTNVHLEVYLPEQVAVLFEGGKVRLITHISSGSGEFWEELVMIDPGEDGNQNGKEPIAAIVRGFSVTPGGVYKFNRRYVDPATGGWREGRLGRMFKPVYFNKGIAVHGSGNVPSYPASHGCIRIPMHIAEYFPELVKNGDQVFVFDGKKSPEYYGAQPPRSDSITRVSTTTTTTTSTTVKKTTTTVKKTTTTTSSSTLAPE